VFHAQHVSVALMYVFSLVLHVLAGTYKFLLIMDKYFSLSRQLRRFKFHRTLATFCLAKHGNPVTLRSSSAIFLRLFVTCFRFCPGVDVDARQRHKQLPRRHFARAQDQDDLGAVFTHGRLACACLSDLA
jgi:hypothetical protein